MIREYAERRRIRDGAPQGWIDVRGRHHLSRCGWGPVRQRKFDPEARSWLEAQAEVVARVALEHDERFVASIGEGRDGCDEKPADALAVERRIDGQRVTTSAISP